jgi:hypothetical protein
VTRIDLLFLFIILGTEVYISKNPGSDLIGTILKIASYTYGPLLGLFSFGIFTKRSIRDRYSLIICILAPIVCYYLAANSEKMLNGYKFGYELLILNGLLTFVGLWIISLGIPNISYSQKLEQTIKAELPCYDTTELFKSLRRNSKNYLY